MTKATLKSSMFSLPGCSGHWRSLCSHPPPFWGLTVMWYIFYQSWDSWGFASCLVATESLTRSGKELLSGSHGTGWLMQVCLGSSQQGLEARVGRGAMGQVCRCAGWCPPSQLQRPSEREKGKRDAGDSGTWESPLLLGNVSRTARAQTQRTGGASAGQRQPWSTAIVSVFILASTFWARSSLGVCM